MRKSGATAFVAHQRNCCPRK